MEIKFLKNGKCVGRIVVERFAIKGEVWPFYERLPEKVELEVKEVPKIEEGGNFRNGALVVSACDPWCYLLYINPEYMRKLGVKVEIKKVPFVREVERHERKAGYFLAEVGYRKEVYLNGIRIGTHDNILYKGEIPVEYQVEKIEKEEKRACICGHYKSLWGNLEWLVCIFVPLLKDKYEAIHETTIHFDTKRFKMQELPDNAKKPIWDLVYKVASGLV